MTSIAFSPVSIQTSPQSVPATPSWFGEITLIAHYLTQHGVLEAIKHRVRFARRRFGHYDVIDFVAVLLGYALSGERTLADFYERLLPFASAFMALFGRERLPHRSTLSRFLASLEQAPVEALRTLFLEDLLARPLSTEPPGGLWDRCGGQWLVFDVDGTRQAARQRALPQTADRPAPQRRLRGVCAPGYLGRKRGEVVRTRTTLVQAHTHQWLGTFGGPGNGDYRGELRYAAAAIRAYLQAQQPACIQGVVRLDGQYGNGVIVEDLTRAGLAYVMRGKDYQLLDRAEVQARLQLPPDQQTTHPETGTQRALYDCPDLGITATGQRSRVIVATHPASPAGNPIGTTREGVVYELFFTCLPQDAFTAADVVGLYLHRGAFESVLAAEDQEQDPDRWCCQRACGQECWQILSQWVWNLRLELGHHLHPTPLRTTQWAPAQAPLAPPVSTHVPALPDARAPEQAPPLPIAGCDHPPRPARAARPGMFAGADFTPQADGTLRCPAGERLTVRERRQAPDGTLRIYYAPPVSSCRACRLRADCLRAGSSTKAPRRVSVIQPPSDPSLLPKRPLRTQPPALPPPPPLPGRHPILWRDWGRCCTRREWMSLLRTQTVLITPLPPPPRADPVADLEERDPVTRPQRAHWRLAWTQRLARNASSPLSPRVTLQLFGIPPALATFLGLAK